MRKTHTSSTYDAETSTLHNTLSLLLGIEYRKEHSGLSLSTFMV